MDKVETSRRDVSNSLLTSPAARQLSLLRGQLPEHAVLPGVSDQLLGRMPGRIDQQFAFIALGGANRYPPAIR